MQKFLVVSYDDDQQQWFWDFVAAPTANKAIAMVCKDRPYVIAADASTCQALRNIANNLEKLSVEQIRAMYKRSIREA